MELDRLMNFFLSIGLSSGYQVALGPVRSGDTNGILVFVAINDFDFCTYLRASHALETPKR
jgi:hypothetical protein